MNDRYQNNLRDQLDAISPGIYDKLEKVQSFDDTITRQVLAVIIKFCCQGQNFAGISAGKDALMRLPQPWMNNHLPDIVASSLNLSDEWEYRRLLEVLDETSSTSLRRYIAFGLASENEEIREAANDIEKLHES